MTTVGATGPELTDSPRMLSGRPVLPRGARRSDEAREMLPLRHRQREQLQREPRTAIARVAPEIADRLRDGSLAERAQLARDPDSPEALLVLLAHDRGEVLCELVRNPASPPRALAVIAAMLTFEPADNNDRWYHYEAMRRVARDPRCPIETLHELSGPAADAVVVNPACPPELLAEYCEEGWGRQVNTCGAKHPSTPTDSLLTVIAEDGPAAAAACRNIARRDHASIRAAMLLTHAGGRQTIARAVTDAEQERLAGDPDVRVRYAVAVTATDPSLLAQLSRDPHGRVRRGASNRLLAALG